ncbi:MAG TPA: SPFH domain-containing protein [Dehalococcoidia bacterium]|nr:SPFH domain-containing protein [Dehalococcoidia bacterium]
MQWLERLISAILDLFPRIWMIFPDEAGIRITGGSRFRPKGPGWYAYWPIIQECVKITVTPQIIDLRDQSLTTSDGHVIAISGAVEYSIRDAKKAILDVQDLDKSLPALCLGKITEYVEVHTLAECRAESLKDELKMAIRSHVNDWGIKLREVFITDAAKARVIRLMLPIKQGESYV